MERDERGRTAFEPSGQHVAADDFFHLAMSCTLGRSGPVDLVAAHKWFNVAATLGNAEAIRLRREIAAEMSETEITTAQRAARDWLTTH